MNSAIKSGGLKELEFGGTSPCVSGRGVGCHFFSNTLCAPTSVDYIIMFLIYTHL